MGCNCSSLNKTKVMVKEPQKNKSIKVEETKSNMNSASLLSHPKIVDPENASEMEEDWSILGQKNLISLSNLSPVLIPKRSAKGHLTMIDPLHNNPNFDLKKKIKIENIENNGKLTKIQKTQNPEKNHQNSIKNLDKNFQNKKKSLNIRNNFIIIENRIERDDNDIRSSSSSSTSSSEEENSLENKYRSKRKFLSKIFNEEKFEKRLKSHTSDEENSKIKFKTLKAQNKCNNNPEEIFKRKFRSATITPYIPYTPRNNAQRLSIVTPKKGFLKGYSIAEYVDKVDSKNQ